VGDRVVPSAEWGAFMGDDGYARRERWRADGWGAVQREGWGAPTYWRPDGAGGWVEFDLHGLRALDPHAPVRHVCGYEADAYARWAGARLPTEAEWEWAAADLIDDPARPRPSYAPLAPAGAAAAGGFRQVYGACWQWTASAFTPYPGYRPPQGAIGEYNGKFMSGQIVLRGGSALTQPGHSRPSYRNFFYPHQRWQMAGLRLARDA